MSPRLRSLSVEVGRAGATARVDNPTDKGIIIMDRATDVGVDIARSGDTDNIHVTTTIMDKGEAVELVKSQN